MSFIGAGELVPTSALGTSPHLEGRPIPIPLALGSQVEPGELVDVWALAGSGLDSDAEARQLASGVDVLSVSQDGSIVTSGSGLLARVLIPQDAVHEVLEAQAAGATLAIVEHPGG